MEAVERGTVTVCVTGAVGFLASWLVKLLLSTGRYAVRGTVRRLGDAKNAHLTTLEHAGERLQLVKADLLDYASVAAAVAVCEGVFHVASPVPSGKPSNSEADIIAPAVTGIQNVLKACYEAKVKRVVVLSSVAAVFNNPNWPKARPLLRIAGQMRSIAEKMRNGISFLKHWPSMRLLLMQQQLG